MEDPESPVAIRSMHCPECGYDLRAHEGEQLRCPECGGVFLRSELLRSPIPWTHRRDLGRIRALLRTCRIALGQPKQLAIALDAPLPFADAQRFWLLCAGAYGVALALALGLIAGPIRINLQPDPLVTYPQTFADHLRINLLPPWAIGMESHLALPLCICAFVLMLTGSLSYFFTRAGASRREKDRAAAVGLYVSGALISGLLWGALASSVLLIIIALDALRTSMPAHLVRSAFPFLAVLALSFGLPCWALSCCSAYRHLRGGRFVAWFSAAVFTAALTSASLLLAFLLLPFLAGIVLILIATLR